MPAKLDDSHESFSLFFISFIFIFFQINVLSNNHSKRFCFFEKKEEEEEED